MRAVVAVLVFGLAGCTVTRRLARLPTPPPVAEPLAARVTLVIRHPRKMFRAIEPRLARLDRTRVEAALRKSGCFTFDGVRLEVDPVVAWLAFPVALAQALDPGDPRLAHLELELELDSTTRWQLLSPLTLGLFPRYQEDHLALSATLRAPGGAVLAQVEHHERLGTWTSCLLYPQLSWKFGQGCGDQALEALVANVSTEVVRGVE